MTYDDKNLSVISQANIGGVDYKLKDAAARTVIDALGLSVQTNEANIAINAGQIADIKKEIKGGIHYLGKTRTELSEGASPEYIEVLSGETWVKYYKASENPSHLLLKAGDLVITAEESSTVEADEFIWNGTTWNRLGSTKGLGSLAFKDEASGSFTPAGSVTVDAIADATYDLTGTVTINEVSATGAVTINQVTPTGSFTGTAVTPTGSFTGTAVTPTGSFTGTEITPTATFTGTAVTPTGSFTGSEGSLSVTGTAVGTVSKPNVTVTPSSTATGSASVNNEILTISFGTALTSVAAELAAAPEFTGGAFESTGKFTPTGSIAIGSVTPSGNIAVGAITPSGSISISAITPSGSIAINEFTPGGSVTVDAFTPTGSIAINKFTPTGSVAGSTKVAGHTHTATFAGTAGTVEVS